LRPDTT